jgi:hypothetical protein
LPRKLIAAAATAAAALVAAAPAGAAPVALDFDHVVLDTQATPNAEVVSPSTDPLKVNADVDLATGDFTVQPADFDFPEYSFSTPVQGTIDIFLHEPASGHADFATGKLAFTGTFDAKVTVNGIGDCTKTVGPTTLTTETTNPLPGQPFPPGPTGPASGNGAFGVGWDSLDPGTGPGCGLIDSFTSGEGGIWISRGIDPSTYGNSGAAKLALALRKPQAIEAGRKATVRARVRNTGDDAARSVKVCLRAPKPLSPRRHCRGIGRLGAGKAKRVAFKVKSKRRRPGTFTLRGKATGKGIKAARDTTRLRVRP